MRSNKNVSNICKTIFAYAGRGLVLGVLALGISATGCDDDGGGDGPDSSVLNDGGGADTIKIDAPPKTDASGDSATGDAQSGDAQSGDAAGDALTLTL